MGTNPAGCAVSRVLSRLAGGSPARRGRPFIWTRRCRRALRRRVRRQKRPTRDGVRPKADGLNHATSLLGLAPGGVCHARPVTRPAVRSYRTISPLPCFVRREADYAGRYLFCGTVPVPGEPDGSGPAGRWALPTTAVQRRSDFPPPARIERGAAFHASGRGHYTAGTRERGKRVHGFLGLHGLKEEAEGRRNKGTVQPRIRLRRANFTN